MSEATERIRLGTLVLNNEMRNPVQLAWEAATLDRLSSGRLELGLGAGHTPEEWRATGIEMENAAVRKERLAESVVVIRRLLDGQRVDFDGNHYQVLGAEIEPSFQDRLPILVGGNGESLLRHAGANADIIGLQGLGKTMSDGHRHSVRWTPNWLTEQIGQVRSGAGDRFGGVELSALVQVVEITDDREQVLTDWCKKIGGTVDDLSAMPYLMVGSVDEIVDHIRRCRERWGISYFTVRSPAFSAIIDAIRSRP
jgi:probable F420-dependent oxidoreductase